MRSAGDNDDDEDDSDDDSDDDDDDDNDDSDDDDSDDDSDDDDDEVAWISFCLRASSLLIDARSIIFPGNAFIATGYDANALWARIEKNTE